MFQNNTELSSKEVMLAERVEELVQMRDTITFEKVLKKN